MEATRAPKPEKSKFVIACDFDGTITENRQTAKLFYENYSHAFFRQLGKHDLRNFKFVPEYYSDPKDQKTRTMINNIHFDAALAKVYKEPGLRGWKKVDGHVVSAAESDPYQLAKAAAEELLDQLGRMDGAYVPDKEQYNKFLEPVFQEAHKKLKEPIFREGAKEFLEMFYGPKARQDVQLVFVTNSKEHSVREKLKKLLDGSEIDYKKIIIKEDAEKEYVEDFSKEIRIDDIPRPLYTERVKYIKLLKEIGADVVVGDNNELDGIAAMAILGLPFIFIADEGPIKLWDAHASRPAIDVIGIMKDGLQQEYKEKYIPVSSLNMAAVALLGLANAKIT